MTDLELMELLEENGYEPSLENLMILKEQPTLIDYSSVDNGSYQNTPGQQRILKTYDANKKKYDKNQNFLQHKYGTTEYNDLTSKISAEKNPKQRHIIIKHARKTNNINDNMDKSMFDRFRFGVTHD